MRARRLFAFGLSGLLLLGCEGRSRPSDKKEGPALSGEGYVAHINLFEGAPEGVVADGLFPRPASETFVGLIRALGRIENDKAAKSVFVRLRGHSFGFAQAKELGERLHRVGKKKKVVCHTHQADNATYWLLSQGCQQIWVSAAGDVPTVGIGAELSYIKGAFDKLGIVPDMLAMGKYKSGGEALTRTSPSEDSLRNLQSTLSDLRREWLTGVSSGRSFSEARKKHVEDGPWSPERAKDLGLIDHVGFEDEALESAKTAAGTEEIKVVFGPGAQAKETSPAAELVRFLAGAEARESRDRIVVVPALGSITMEAGGPFGGGEGITASAMTRTLRRLRKDDSVRAVVMRMDSPGGSPLASDLIWREMMLLRSEKPVIVSIAGMSASGGYYIASGASKIVASPTAIVGSIGVFGGKIVLGGALQKIGVTSYPVAASPEEGARERATHLSPMTPWDEPTRERVRESMKRIYDLFVERVAEGRDLSKEKVYATAEGEIYLAGVGKQRGLIDELGGVEKALEIAREQGDLPANIPVVVEGGEESILSALFLGPDPEADDVKAALLRYERRRIEEGATALFGVDAGSLRPFAAFVAPLLAGESVVAALPYSLQIR